MNPSIHQDKEINSKQLTWKQFFEQYSAANLIVARKLAFFSLVLFLLYAVLDGYLSYPDDWTIVKMRLVSAVILFLILLLTYIEKLKNHWQWIAAAYVFFAGLSVVIMALYIPAEYAFLYSQGVLIVVFYGYAVSHMLLIQSSVAGISIFISYVLFCLYSPNIDSSQLLVATFFHATANMIGIYTAYQRQMQQVFEYQQAADLAQLNQQLKNMANTDGLTGIGNRRAFNESIEALLTATSDDTVALVLSDIDFFKQFNDSYGHLKGDECLVHVAFLMDSVVQASPGSKVFRFGGEEFALLIQGQGAEKVVQTLHSIQRALINHPMPGVEPITLSFGCHIFNLREETTAEEVIAAADCHLYLAKANGRNRIEGGC